MESDLVALLQSITPRIYPDVAPEGVVVPYATWQAIGGDPLRYGDGTAADKRNTYLQVSIWSSTRAEASSLIHQVEEALCLSPAFAASEPKGEAMSTWEPVTKRYGSIQRFDIWATR